MYPTGDEWIRKELQATAQPKNLMNSAAIVQICQGVTEVVVQIRAQLRSSNNNRREVLDAFWYLQDQLSRLVASADNYPQETFEVLRYSYPKLVNDVISLLAFTARLKTMKVAAVNQSCDAANESLIQLEQIKQRRRSAE